MARIYFVYILSNWNNNVLYIGVTNNIERRAAEHSGKYSPGFTRKYKINKLVYFEEYSTITTALSREKSLKNLLRCKKIALVESKNPEWLDLSKD